MSRRVANSEPLLVFLCGARDFHAMDWFRSARQTLTNDRVCILTDLIAGEGFKDLTRPDDRIFRLIILDRFLLTYQSSFGNLWRNLVKLLVFPAQVWLVKRFDRRHPSASYFCHSMYYLFLARAAGVKYLGAPQGSDILVKPFRSRLYRHFAIQSLKSATNVTVDSRQMQQTIFELCGVRAEVIQNGIDVRSILKFTSTRPAAPEPRKYILSNRGFTALYRIADIISARNRSARYRDVPIALRYPFYEANYRAQCLALVRPGDEDIGRVDVGEMHRLFVEARLVVSIPKSDSSPKSVSEAIFYGCAVAITYHAYYDDLPACMKSRVILVDLQDPEWLGKALDQADLITRIPYVPTEQAISTFDKIESFKKILDLIHS